MTLSEAEDIYAVKYATACHFDELPSGPDCVVFDTGVNSGPSRGIKIAQYIVGVPADGVIGPITLKAICDYNAVDFVNRHCDQRMAFLRRLGNWPVFRGGWTSRVSDLRRYSLGLATGKPKLAAGYAKKEPVILHAHVKAYAAEDVAALKAEHGHEDNHEQR